MNEFNALRRQSWSILHEISGYLLLVEAHKAIECLKKFNPSEPRVPAGSPDGGQWTNGFSDAIEPVYPLETLIGIVFGGAILSELFGVFNFFGNIAESVGGTVHGVERLAERAITQGDINLAIKSAEKAGSTFVKIGKYGTPQMHYVGTNGVTVIIENGGRNAGKIITSFRP